MLERTRLLMLLVAVGLSACFIESAQPTTFRFQCSKTDECPDGEVCSDGLCQQPCGAGMESCGNTTACINGFCSNICPVDEDVCSAPQECVALPTEDGEPGSSGICTIPCDDADHPCAEGQLCGFGICVTLCMTTDDCGSGEACTEFAPGASVCVPSGSGGGGFP